MTDNNTPLIEFTDLARDTVLHFMDMEEDSDFAVRVAVSSPSPLDPRYEITLIEPHERTPEDLVFDDYGFDVVVASDSAELLKGARIDWIETLNESGFKVQNPNLAPIGSTPLEGPLAERVQYVIDTYVNPGVAQHGGQVGLVDVRDKVVYLQLGGGCQGCGMASVTLRQGIERIIKEQVPEVVAIEDVTNHSAGQNPYYAPSK